MALTNIELYEALKKDVSEEAARMIAEVVPQAGDLATKGDIARLQQATTSDIARLQQATTSDIARLEAGIARLEQVMEAREERLKSYLDSRLLRLTAMIVVPLMVSALGTLAALFTLVVKI